MHDSVGTEDVDGYKTTVEVDRGALERDTNSETLCVPKILAGCIQSWDSV